MWWMVARAGSPPAPDSRDHPVDRQFEGHCPEYQQDEEPEQHQQKAERRLRESLYERVHDRMMEQVEAVRVSATQARARDSSGARISARRARAQVR